MSLVTPVGMLAYASELEPLRKAHYILEMVNSQQEAMPDASKYHISGLGQLTDEIGTEQYKPFNSAYDIPVSKASTSLSLNVRFFSDKTLWDFFSKWFKDVYNPDTDEFGLYDSIVGSGVLKLYGPSERNQSDPAAPTTPLYTITLLDVFPKGITIESLESDDEGGSPAMWSVALSVGMVLRSDFGD